MKQTSVNHGRRTGISVMVLGLGLNCLFSLSSASTATAGPTHAQPPPGDPCLTNRFGRSWSDPIYSGYLFVDGRYIDAPYVVEQRGYVIFINDVRTEPAVDIRRVLPPPPSGPPPAKPIDPGLPTNLTRNSSLVEVLMHPVVRAKQQYWTDIGFYGQERVNATVEFLSAIPSIARIVDTGDEGLVNQRSITIYDHNGRRVGLNVPLEPLPPPPQPPTDEECHSTIIDMCRLMETRLKHNGAVFICGNQLRATYPGVQSNPRWQDIFKVFASDAPLEDKVVRLKALGFLPKHKTVETASPFYPINDFKASDQIWQRLEGDASWTNGTSAIVDDLTNGWKRILPKFDRPATVMPMTVQTNPPASVAAQDSHAVSEDAPVPADVLPFKRGRERSWRWLIVLPAVCVVGICAIILRKQRNRNSSG